MVNRGNVAKRQKQKGTANVTTAAPSGNKERPGKPKEDEQPLDDGSDEALEDHEEEEDDDDFDYEGREEEKTKTKRAKRRWWRSHSTQALLTKILTLLWTMNMIGLLMLVESGNVAIGQA